MKAPLLEVTFRRGRPMAAYLRLVRTGHGTVKETKEVFPSLFVDLSETGKPLGVEILAFDARTLDRVNEVLGSLGYPVLSADELDPIRAA
jgi:hypothetical protein